MITQFSCIIVDDEQDAINLLASSLNALYKNITITGTYTFWEDALQSLRQKQADILFMDISMPGKNGIDLLRLLPNLQSEVIFITAHEDFAFEAFEFSTAGYVLKPFEDTFLVSAVDKAIDRIKNKKIAAHYADMPEQHTTKIIIPNSKGFDYIDTLDILYLESVKNYTKIITKTTEILSSYNLGKYKSILNNRSFYQVHRSYIVNIDFITRYEAPNLVIMSDKKEIPIAKGFKDGFLQLFSDIKPKYQQ